MKKGIANIVLIVFLLIIAGLLYVIVKQIPKENPALPVAEKCQPINWQANLAEIKTILISAGLPSVGQVVPVSVEKEVDLTGDGCFEALVLVDAGGAYTNTFALFGQKQNQIVLLEQKETNGEIVKAIFDAGASVRHQLGYQLLPAQNAFVTFAKSLDETGSFLEVCEVNAYFWQPASALFESSRALTASLQPTICQ